MKLLILAAALSVSAAHAQRPTKAALARTIDSLATHTLSDGPVAGLSVAVVRGRDTVVMKGYGFADVENDVPATAQTVYRIGSITKQFTAAAVMQLVEQGRVRLDDTIGTYLTSLPAAWRGVPVRQLLNHTSGIPSYTSAGPRWFTKMRLDLAHDSLLAIVAGDSMDFAPGSSWRYNNTGYYLLGMLLEKVTGDSYAALIQKLGVPLGLRGTMYCDTKPIIKRRAQGYQPSRDGTLANADMLSMTQPFSAGALCSTVGDLVAWQRALAAGRVVSPAMYTTMITPVGSAVGSRYGFGLGTDSLAGVARVQHGGGINGFNSMLAHYPADSVTVVVLANTNGPWADRLADNIARAALGRPLVAGPARLADLPTTKEERDRFAGTYLLQLPDGKTLEVRIFEQDGALHTQGAGQPAFRMHYQGNSTFGAPFDRGMRITFAPGSPSPSVTIVQGGGTVVGQRVK